MIAALVARSRERSPLLDHMVRAVRRYQADAGDRLAASVTFYWFLSLFPIVLLAIYLLRLVKGDAAGGEVSRALSGYLPAELVGTISETIGDKAGKAGAIGFVGLLLAGLGWIDALRGAIRTVWHEGAVTGNIVVRKLFDVVILVGLFVVVGASVFVTGLAASGPTFLLEHLGVKDTGAAVLLTKVVGVVLGIVTDTALFLFLFRRLARVATPVRQVLKGAVFGALCFAVVKLGGGFYVHHTTTTGKATYGAFAVVVGLLLFLNLLSRFVLLSAAFAVTGPYDSDVRPSGMADPGQGRMAWQDESLGVGVEHEVAAQDVAPGERTPPKGAAQVELAARVTGGVLGLVVLAVLVHAAQTVRRTLSRQPAAGD